MAEKELEARAIMNRGTKRGVVKTGMCRISVSGVLDSASRRGNPTLGDVSAL